MKVIVVGAGVIGALTAYRLAQQGAEVTVVDAGQPANAASGASFGWINASFYLDEDHFRLRRVGIEAHHRLAQDLETTAIRWQGCLCWEEEGAALDAQRDALEQLGYGVRLVEGEEFQQLEPSVNGPERALMFPDEGVIDLPAIVRDALSAGSLLGVKMVSGVQIEGIETRGGKVTGVRWSGGVMACDKVLVAGGTGTEHLLADVGVTVPMLDRPGVMMRSKPLPPMLAHILVTPQGELRQDSTGRIRAPTVAAHQSDTTEEITQDPSLLADKRAAEISALISRDVQWEQVSLAWRPVPKDGLPVMGACGPEGLFVSVMHSGATLAPLAAEMVACEVSDQPLNNAFATLIAPYRPQRFTG